MDFEDQCLILQVYAKVSGEPKLETPTIDVSSKEFYGVGYDDSDKRIPDMTIINRQLGTSSYIHHLIFNLIELINSILILQWAMDDRLEPEDFALGLA